MSPARRDTSVVSMQRGGGSKDTWVLSDSPVSQVTLLPTAPTSVRQRAAIRRPAEPRRRQPVLARALRRAGGAHRAPAAQHASCVCRCRIRATRRVELSALMRRDGCAASAAGADGGAVAGRASETQEIFQLRCSSGSARRSCGDTLTEVRRLAASVRDRLSIDTGAHPEPAAAGLPHSATVASRSTTCCTHLNRMIADLAAFSGMEMENMTRGHGWRFLDIGRRLERAAQHGPSASQLRWLRGRHRRDARAAARGRRQLDDLPAAVLRASQLPPVLDLLLADETNARSLAFQVDALSEHMGQLPHDPAAPSPTKEERLAARMSARMADADLDALTAAPPLLELTRLLESIQDDLEALSNAITYYYFAHGEQRVS